MTVCHTFCVLLTTPYYPSQQGDVSKRETAARVIMASASFIAKAKRCEYTTHPLQTHCTLTVVCCTHTHTHKHTHTQTHTHTHTHTQHTAADSARKKAKEKQQVEEQTQESRVSTHLYHTSVPPPPPPPPPPVALLCWASTGDWTTA